MTPLPFIAVLLAAVVAGCAAPPEGQGAAQDVPTASDQSELERRARVRLELAAAYFASGQTETALDEVKQALAVKPDLGDGHNLRGLIYARMGEVRLAEDSFRRALQLNARDADAMHNYAWFLCQQRRHAEADALFAQALAQPNYREIQRSLLTRGVCQARAGRLAEAELSLMRSYELDPSNPATAINLAEVLYRRGEFERARFYVRRVNAQPQLASAQTLWMAVRIEHRLGNRAGVEEYGHQLRSRFPQAPEVLALDQGRFDD